MIICHTVPEICHMMDVIVTFYFGLFFALLPTPNSPKNKNFKKMKNTPGDITILHNCSKNHDHMLYCSWDMAHGRCNCYFSFWAFFFALLPPAIQKTQKNSPKNQNFKKWKKHLEISSFYKCTKNHDYMMYGYWDMVHNGQMDRRIDGRTDERKKETYRGGCPT